ncbi:MAG: hypothetical protein RMK19_03820 [Bacteroidia bacterium]|nr:hypothetical protein [Bacteroidia bacterium]MDW8015119.1 hypothetical protein [Bacteroidia bacterium]
MSLFNSHLLAFGLIGILLGQGFHCGTMEVESLKRALYPDWPRLDAYEPFLRARVQAYKALYRQGLTIGGGI